MNINGHRQGLNVEKTGLIGMIKRILKTESDLDFMLNWMKLNGQYWLLLSETELKVHKVIVDLFSLPGDLTDQIFGDIITSNLPVIFIEYL
jgi:hypothetical protein